MKVVVITPQGEAKERDITGIDGERLRGMQAIVEGFIEVVQLKEVSVIGRPRKRLRIDLICNEEGKIEGLPPNDRATNVMWRYRPAMASAGDFIAGNAFISAADAATGESEDLPEDIIRAIISGEEW